MNKLSGMLLAVLLFAVANAWGNCIPYNDTFNGGYQDYSCVTEKCKDPSFGSTAPLCLDMPLCDCAGVIYQSGDFFYIADASSNMQCKAESQSVCYSFNGGNRICHSYLRCDSQCDADSVLCQNAGGTWTNTGASTCDGYSCKMSNCLQSDTLWLNDSKSACDAIGGENNYAITDIDETCVRSGICCPPDSALVGNTCKWRCDSLYTACTAKNGYLYAGVLQDTTISGEDSIFTNKCYYNCSYAYNKDSTTSVTEGNTACSSPSTPIADCTRMPNDFSSVRTTYGDSVYSYDFLTPRFGSIHRFYCSYALFKVYVSLHGQR